MKGEGCMTEARIKALLPNHDTDYNQYEGLFESVVYIARTLKEKGINPEHINEKDLKTNFESTRRMLKDAVCLMCDGRDEIMIHLIMDLEYNRHLLKTGVTETEIDELLLAKVLMDLFVKGDYDSIYSIITILCSGSIYKKFLPTYPWFEL